MNTKNENQPKEEKKKNKLFGGLSSISKNIKNKVNVIHFILSNQFFSNSKKEEQNKIKEPEKVSTSTKQPDNTDKILIPEKKKFEIKLSIDDNESTKDELYMVKIEGDDDDEEDNDEYEYEEQEASDTPSSSDKKDKESPQTENSDKEITENFPVMGYIKAGNSVIKWTNYVQQVML